MLVTTELEVHVPSTDYYARSVDSETNFLTTISFKFKRMAGC